MNKFTLLKKNFLFIYYLQVRSWKQQSNFYEILGVSKTASIKDIKIAYYNKCKEHHPDNNKNDPKSHERFIDINKAYSILSEKNSRQTYDETLQYSKPSFYYPNPYKHPYPHNRTNMRWNDIEYERYFKYKEELNKRNKANFENSDGSKENFNSPLFVMMGVVILLGLFEVWTIGYIYDRDMNQLQNEPNPFNKHTMSEFKRRIDVNLSPEHHEAEINELIRKNKENESRI